jgi:hypothetical protein
MRSFWRFSTWKQRRGKSLASNWKLQLETNVLHIIQRLQKDSSISFFLEGRSLQDLYVHQDIFFFGEPRVYFGVYSPLVPSDSRRNDQIEEKEQEEEIGVLDSSLIQIYKDRITQALQQKDDNDDIEYHLAFEWARGLVFFARGCFFQFSFFTLEDANQDHHHHHNDSSKSFVWQTLPFERDNQTVFLLYPRIKLKPIYFLERVWLKAPNPIETFLITTFGSEFGIHPTSRSNLLPLLPGPVSSELVLEHPLSERFNILNCKELCTCWPNHCNYDCGLCFVESYLDNWYLNQTFGKFFQVNDSEQQCWCFK